MDSTPKNFQLCDKSVASIIEASPIGTLLASGRGEIVFVNKKAEVIFGYSKEELLVLTVESLVPSRFRESHVAKRKAYESNPQSRSMGANRHLSGLTKTGVEIPIEVGLSPLKLDGESFVLISVIDVSERERLAQLERTNEKLSIAANHDELTGLPNRRLFSVLFRKFVHLATLKNNYVTLMFLDLDGFKEVNDSYGHQVGDELLVSVAEVLSSSIRESDLAARIGGDEFLICLDGDTDCIGVKSVAQTLIEKVGAIKGVHGHDIEIGVSIGSVRTLATDNVPLEDLLCFADNLMYQAKAEGKGCWKFSDYKET